MILRGHVKEGFKKQRSRQKTCLTQQSQKNLWLRSVNDNLEVCLNQRCQYHTEADTPQ